MIGKTEWPHILADLKAKRDALTQIIVTIETHFLPIDGAMPDSIAVGRSSSAPRSAKDRRATPAAGGDDPLAKAVAGVRAALQKRQGWSPKELARETGASGYSLKRALDQLRKDKAITIVGKNRAQKLYLPGKAPKEGL